MAWTLPARSGSADAGAAGVTGAAGTAMPEMVGARQTAPVSCTLPLVWRVSVSLAVAAALLLGADRGGAIAHESLAAEGPARSVDTILAAVRQATVRYLDVERARADGFVQISGM